MIFYLLNLIVFSIPAYLIRFSFFGAPFTLLEVFIYILFIIWIFQFKKGRKMRFDAKIWVPVLLLFYGATVSTIFSSNLIASAGIWKSYFLDPLLFLAVFIDVFGRMDAKNQELKINGLLKRFLFSGYFVAIIAFAYLLSQNLTYDGRLSAFYLSPNHLAMFLAPVFLVNLYFFFKTSGIKKVVLFSGAILIALLLYATHSLGAWAGLIVSILFWLFLKYKLLFNRKIIFGLAIFLGFLFAAIIWKLPAIADYFDVSGRSSLHSRLMIWRSAVEILKNNWILGIGPGMFQEYYLAYQKYFIPYLEWAVPQPHNIFLAFWLQTGVLGIIGFVYTMIMLFFCLNEASLWQGRRVSKYFSFFIPRSRCFHPFGTSPLALIPAARPRGFRAKGDKKNYTGLHLLAISFLIYFLIHGLVDTIYWKNDLALIFWFFAGLIFILSPDSTIKNA